MNLLRMVEDIRKTLDDKLGENIVCLDLIKVSSVTDYLIICTADRSDTHVRMLAKHLVDEMKKIDPKHRPIGIEGADVGKWACVDYGGIIVHIMRENERELYDLEAIWGAAPRVCEA